MSKEFVIHFNLKKKKKQNVIAVNGFQNYEIIWKVHIGKIITWCGTLPRMDSSAHNPSDVLVLAEAWPLQKYDNNWLNQIKEHSIICKYIEINL